MKILCAKDDLVKGIDTVQGAVSTKSTLPILSNILIEAFNDYITLICTDLDMGITCQVQAKTSETGALTVPAKKFSDIIKELPDAEINLSSKKNNTLTIICKNAQFKIMGLPKDEFPKFPDFKNKNPITVPQQVLKTMIDMTTFAASRDETRYILNGVHLRLKDGILRIVATDGRRLAFIEKEIDAPKSVSEQITIPTKAIGEVSKNLKEEGDAKITFTENQILFDMEKARIISRLIEGEFPDYEQVIPKENKNKVVIDREGLLLATKRISLFTNQDSQAVRFDIHKNGMVISKSTPDIGEAREEVDVLYAGSDITIGFNPAYIMDVLKRLKEDNIGLELGGSGEKPGVIRTGDNYVYVVLPMQLS